MDSLNSNDWAHMHDCVLDLTWNTSKINLSKDEMVILFNKLPNELQKEAFEWGMNDTLWKDKFREWYIQNK